MVKRILAQGLKTLEQVEQLILPWLHSYRSSQSFVAATYKTRNSHKLKEFEQIDLVLQHQKRYLIYLSQTVAANLSSQDRSRAIADLKYKFVQQLRLNQLHQNRDLLDFLAKVDWVIEQSDIDLEEWLPQAQRDLVHRSRQVHARFLQLLAVSDREHQLVDITNQGIHVPGLALDEAKAMLRTMEELPTFRISYDPPLIKESHRGGYQFPQGLLRIKVEAKLCHLANLYLRHHRPVQFMMGGASTMKDLFQQLRSIPSLILGGELSGHFFALNHGFWGINWHEYRAQPLMPAIPWLEIAITFAQQAALTWQREQMTADAGKTTDHHFYSLDELKAHSLNLTIMAREQEAQNQGLDQTRIYRPYAISNHNMEDCVDYLVMFHAIYAGLFIDEYYLLHAPIETPLVPLLPLLLGEIIDEPYRPHLSAIVDSVLNYYEFLYASVEAKGEGSMLPEMRLNHAEMLWELGDRPRSQAQINQSLSDWVKLQGESPEAFPHLLGQFKRLVNAGNQHYVAHLNRCLLNLGERTIDLPKVCLDKAIKLFKQQRYTNAIAKLNQAIELKPDYGKAYYHLGLCHSHLQRYEDSIVFYDHAIDLGYRLDNVHHHRGYSYFRLKLYDEAIADYQAAVSLGCGAAKHNLKVVRIFKEEQIKQAQQTIDPMSKLTTPCPIPPYG